MEFQEEKEDFNRFIFEFTESVGPNTQFILNLEEDQTEDLRAALEYCSDRSEVDSRIVDDLLELLEKPGMVPFSAGILVVSLCAVDEYMRHLIDEGEQDELFSYKDLLYYLCANAEELVRTLH